jgi:DNA-binding transcriptional regulator YiaG
MTEIGVELMESMAKTLRNARNKRLRPSQLHFAVGFGVSASTLRKWEQGQYAPSGAANGLLKMIALESDAVLRALAASAEKISSHVLGLIGP